MLSRKKLRQAESAIDPPPSDSSLTEDDDAEDDGDPDKEYEIEVILDHRYDDVGGVEYLVAWKGYDAKWNLWIPRENCDGCEGVLAEYNKRWNVKTTSAKHVKASKKMQKRKTLPPTKEIAQTSSSKVPRGPLTSSSSFTAMAPVRTSNRLHDKRKSRRPLGEMTNDDLEEIIDEAVRDQLKRKIAKERFGNMAGWEDVVLSIDGWRMEGDVAAIGLHFKGGFHFAVPLDIVCERCPQLLIKFLWLQVSGGRPAPRRMPASTAAQIPLPADRAAANPETKSIVHDEEEHGNADSGTLTALLDNEGDDLEYVDD